MCLCQVLNGPQTRTVWQRLTAGTETGEFPHLTRSVLHFDPDGNKAWMVVLKFNTEMMTFPLAPP